MHRLLLSAEATGGGGTPPPAAAAVIDTLNPPTAAELVEARRKLQEKDLALRNRETRIAELEDENHRLKAPPKAPATTEKGKLDEWLFD